MDALTVQGEQCEDGEDEVRARGQAQPVNRLVMRFHGLQLLDDLFLGFVCTNKRRGCGSDFPMLLMEATHYKKYYFFEYSGIRYLASTSLKSFPDRDIINIKLVNNGYFYVSVIGDHVGPHKANSYVRLPTDKCLGYFHTLRKVTSDMMYQCSAALYSCSTQRFDIKFEPDLNSIQRMPSRPSIMVTYECGYPYIDDTCEFEPVAA